ncbi:hypothetical protein [Sphingosinicella rhizophila]|uniref:Uncharacterized protein n=1 Tax=Sphingosinicella rhizophila TaxID=3050082 RepID=A0ABU3Q5A7_9SPHN|nr:hypothetical protein [Sphingosinicella sp. GR2756]MDT9598120.1 hypothetical protein [Sphingosinicella sp. GR2756]
MVSRKVAVAAACSLLLATSPVVAQTAPDQTPTSNVRPIARQNSMTNSGLLLMLGAIAGAILLTILATQIGGDEPASP